MFLKCFYSRPPVLFANTHYPSATIPGDLQPITPTPATPHPHPPMNHLLTLHIADPSMLPHYNSRTSVGDPACLPETLSSSICWVHIHPSIYAPTTHTHTFSLSPARVSKHSGSVQPPSEAGVTSARPAPRSRGSSQILPPQPDLPLVVLSKQNPICTPQKLFFFFFHINETE